MQQIQLRSTKKRTQLKPFFHYISGTCSPVVYSDYAVAKDILKNLLLGIDLTVISGKQQTDLIFAFGGLDTDGTAYEETEQKEMEWSTTKKRTQLKPFFHYISGTNGNKNEIRCQHEKKQ